MASKLLTVVAGTRLAEVGSLLWGAKMAMKTRSSWLNCALRDDEAVYWVSIGHYEAVAVGN